MTEANTILAIDPGKTGALAFVSDLGDIVAVYDMPVIGSGKSAEVSGSQIAKWIAEHKPARAVIERVNAMPGQGVTSMFSFGQSFGVVKGVVAGCFIPMDLVTPAKWMGAMNLSGKDKENHRQRAIQRWPSADCFARKKDHGRAEACLLAMWSITQTAPLSPKTIKDKLEGAE